MPLDDMVERSATCLKSGFQVGQHLFGLGLHITLSYYLPILVNGVLSSDINGPEPAFSSHKLGKRRVFVHAGWIDKFNFVGMILMRLFLPVWIITTGVDRQDQKYGG